MTFLNKMENSNIKLEHTPIYLSKKKYTNDLNNYEKLTKIKKIGEGTYGIVYHARTSANKDVVVKVHILEKTTDFIGNIKELDLLCKLKNHPNIINIKWYTFEYPFLEKSKTPMRSKKTKEDKLYFIFDKADYDLETMIYHRSMSYDLLKKAMMDILISIEYTHSKFIIHRDLKPANFLWFESEKLVKLCDFGLSKMYTYQGSHTPGVVTEYYRAPEVCMKYSKYDYKMDIWSIGCIFYEMIMKRAFIRSRTTTSKNTLLLNKIIEMLPEKITLKDIERYNDVYKEIKIIQKSTTEIIYLTEERKKEFNKTPGSLSSFNDLIKKLLKFHPDQRLSAYDALDHEFFDGFRKDINEIRSKLYDEGLSQQIILHKRPENQFIRKVSLQLFKGRDDYVWYNHRILFLSIDIFERYLDYYLNFNDEIMDQSDIWIKFAVCVYMSIKYFMSLSIPPSFFEILQTKFRNNENKLKCENFERELLTKVLDKGIYRGSIYEYADDFQDILTDDDVEDMLKFYINCDFECNMMIRDLYKIYRNSKGQVSSPPKIELNIAKHMIPTIKSFKESRLIVS
jgi:serine/threonine protein kinase